MGLCKAAVVVKLEILIFLHLCYFLFKLWAYIIYDIDIFLYRLTCKSLPSKFTIKLGFKKSLKKTDSFK